MKKLYFLPLLIVLLMTACHQKPKVAIEPGPAQIEFDDKYLTGEFDTIYQDKQPYWTYDFHFVNKGSEPLVINKVEPNCFCIDADYTKFPIKPGYDGKISVRLHAAELPLGYVCRSVTVYTNASNYPTVRLQVEGIIK